MLWESLMEEKFFFIYHLHREVDEVMRMPINERKWYIERFVVQKQKEHDAMESAKRKAKRSSK